jgi:hypothetical protein
MFGLSFKLWNDSVWAPDPKTEQFLFFAFPNFFKIFQCFHSIENNGKVKIMAYLK